MALLTAAAAVGMISGMGGAWGSPASADSTYWVDACNDGPSGTNPPSALYFYTTPTVPPFFSEGAGMCSQVMDQPGGSGTSFSRGTGGWDVLPAPPGERYTAMQVEVPYSTPGGTTFDGWTFAASYGSSGDTGMRAGWRRCATYTPNQTATCASGWTNGLGGPWTDCANSAAPCLQQGYRGPTAIVPTEAVAFGVWCGLSTCAEPPNVNSTASVDGWEVEADDPSNGPTIAPDTGGSLWHDLGHWISGEAGKGDSLTIRASDPGGVCTLRVALVPVWSQDGSTAGQALQPQSTSGVAYNPADRHFTQTACGAGPVPYVANTEMVPTGAYQLAVTSQNPAEYAAGTSTVAQNIPLLYVDNNTPSTRLASRANQKRWYSTPPRLTVFATDGAEANGHDAGIGRITCAGDGIQKTWPGSSNSSLSVRFTERKRGTDRISCYSVNGVGTMSNTAVYTVHLSAPVKLRGPLRVKLLLGWRWFRSTTTLMHLTAHGLTRKATLTIACRGPRCPFRAVTAHRGHFGSLLHRSFHPGDILTVTVNAPGHRPERARLLIVRAQIPRQLKPKTTRRVSKRR